ncbi:MAG: hypothetical protein IKB93_05000 [Clostridia bacterium]|nr:hypothetical protein [Clostridia bacterium]
MNYNEIIKLLDAGYSRDEILQMDAKEPEPAPEPEPEPEPAPDPTAAIMSEVKEMFAEMRKELTAMNIMNSRLQDDHTEPEDILANIINPTKNNGGIPK